MTALSAMPETSTHQVPDQPDDPVLLPYLTQLQQARADQQEALAWLAEHAEEAP